MIRNILTFIFLGLVLLFVVGCSSDLVNPTSQNALNSWSSSWVIYDDELRTNGGNIQCYTELNSPQIIDLSYSDNENLSGIAGDKCIKFSWDGSELYEYATGVSTANYAAFGLVINKNISSLDLSSPAYNTIEFYVKGNLTDDTVLCIAPFPEDNANDKSDPYTYSDAKDFDNTQISNTSWTKLEVSVSPGAFNTDLTKVKTFVSISLKYKGRIAVHGNGGTVYIDRIKLLKK